MFNFCYLWIDSYQPFLLKDQKHSTVSRGELMSQFFAPTKTNLFFAQPSMAMKKLPQTWTSLGSDQSSTYTPIFEKALRDVSVKRQGTAKFVAEVIGVPTPLITWFHNEEIVGNDAGYRYVKKQNRHTLIVPHVTVKDRGEFTCHASNIAGTSSSTAYLHVITPQSALSQEEDFANVTTLDSVTPDESEESTARCITELSLPSKESDKNSENKRREQTTISNIEEVQQPENDLKSFDVSSSTGVSQSESVSEDYGTRHRSKIKIRRIRVGRKGSRDINTESFDWTEVVRKLIREELEAKENERLVEQSTKLETENAQETYSPNFIRPIVDCNVRAGETAHFVYILSAEPSAEVTWLHNGVPLILHDKTSSGNEARTASYGNIGFIADDNAGCLIISESGSSHSGVYTCVASNICGNIKCSASLIVTRRPNDQLDIHKSNEDEIFTSRLIDQESQTQESRLEDEDQFITDAFKQLENAEKMHEVEDIIIDDSLTDTGKPYSELNQGNERYKRSKELTQTRIPEMNIGRMDDNETGEGLLQPLHSKPVKSFCTCTHKY